MELSKLFGLPAHPLLVHVPVVLIPLAAVGALVIVFSAKMRDRLGWVVAGIAVVGGLGAFLAAGAGEELESALRANGEEISSGLEHHTELGDTAKIFGLLFALAVVVYVAIDHYLKRKAKASASPAVEGAPAAAPAGPSALKKYGMPIAAAATIITGALATTWMIQAGHTGAKSSWEDVYTGG